MGTHTNTGTTIAYGSGRIIPPGETRTPPDDNAESARVPDPGPAFAPAYAAPMKSLTVELTAAQVKALNATPVTLVAAPGAGKALILIGAALWLDFNTVAYDGIASGEDLTIKYSDGNGAALATVETTGFLDATADAFRYVYPTTTAAIAPVANAPLVLHMLAGEIATGNSPLKLLLLYRELSLPW